MDLIPEDNQIANLVEKKDRYLVPNDELQSLTLEVTSSFFNAGTLI
jgi:hypothetical protein